MTGPFNVVAVTTPTVIAGADVKSVTEPVKFPEKEVAVTTPTLILGAESASLYIFPVRLPAKELAVTTPAVILLTIGISALVPSARNRFISPPFPVILFIPDILFGLITVISLFIIPPQNYHQHSEHR